MLKLFRTLSPSLQAVWHAGKSTLPMALYILKFKFTFYPLQAVVTAVGRDSVIVPSVRVVHCPSSTCQGDLSFWSEC